jgi:PAS domain S-box-containing protein
MGGLLFSKQVQNPVLRFSVVLASVSVPLFASGNLLARHGGQGWGRIVLVTGVALLLLGAAATLSEFSDVMADQQVLARSGVNVIRLLGALSLALGLFVVLFRVVRTGEAIEEVGDRFRSLADLMSEGFVLSSPNGTIVLVNQRFLDMLDLSEDMVVGENARELVTRLKVDIMVPHLDMRAQGLASEYEIARRVRGEDRQFWVSGTPIVDPQGRPKGALATVRDVTERNRMAKRLERYTKSLQELVEEQTQKLVQSKEELRDLLLHMNEGFITVDAAYKIQFANNRICELLRITPQAIRGSEVFDFIDASGRVKLMEVLKAESLGRETSSRPEFNFVATDGTLISTMVAVAPVHDPRGTESRYSFVITDITELKRMQRQLELRANELEAVNEELRAYGRAKDGFLSNVSHELKTPLSTINGYVEMLESGSLGSLQAPQVSALRVMGRNVKRLVSLINEMIEFSRMEIRGIQLKVTLFDPAKVVHESVASVQPHALARDISIRIFVPDRFPPVWADRDKISQALGILLNNAVKFSHEGDLIQIRVSERPDRTLAIAVTDTGIGIDPAYHARVFDKFFQIDSSMTRYYEGTGIGLSIAKSILEAHRGRIDIESELNRGSTFTIILPHAIYDAAAPPALGAGMDKLRVLIVAEGETFRRALRESLSNGGCAVAEARNGYECARLAEEIKPNIILFNEVLSDVAGVPTIADLCRNPVTASIPILVLSSEDIAKLTAISGISSCDVHWLTKPFTARDLFVRVRQICFGETIEQQAFTAASTTEPTVLVVDADPDLLEWMAMALSRRDITCVSAPNPERAVELAQEISPDVILMDIDMPPANVTKALALFRDAPGTGHVPICALTGLAAPQHGLPEGVVSVLKKPFSVNELIQAVEKLRPVSTV